MDHTVLLSLFNLTLMNTLKPWRTFVSSQAGFFSHQLPDHDFSCEHQLIIVISAEPEDTITSIAPVLHQTEGLQ